jgi:predicted RNA-binding Zn-ribbon protein involved in translation (DUF1610 family)
LNDFNDLPYENGLMEVTNRRLLQFCRWSLLLICFAAGGFLLVAGNSTGLGILLLLVGLWFVLDNPLESFENLEGPCPFCGHVIQVRRQASFRCPACKDAVSYPDPRMRDGHDESASQIGLKIITPGDTLDLHTFSPKEVPSLLSEFIHLSQEADIRRVNIIHGKGSGALRRLVRKLLGRDPRVVTFYNAPPNSGGWGATVAELKPYQTEDGGEAE